MSLIEKIDALEKYLVKNNSYFEGAEWLFGKVREAILSEQKEPCNYTLEDDDANTWECNKCGVEWALEAGTPEDNEMNYCPKCGREIIG